MTKRTLGIGELSEEALEIVQTVPRKNASQGKPGLERTLFGGNRPSQVWNAESRPL